MKLNKIFSALMLIAAISFAACDEPLPPDNGQQPGQDPDTTQKATTVDIPANVNIPAEAITVGQAREICAGLESTATTGTKYYVKGWVKKIHSKHADGVSGYGNGQFYMSENKYTDGTYDTDDFMAYQVYFLDGAKFTSADQVQEGDYVVVYGELTNYNGTYETVGKGAAYIFSTSRTDNGGEEPNPNPNPTEIDYLEGEMSVTDFLADPTIAGLQPDQTTEEEFVVRGIVKEVKTVSLNYGNAQFTITDGTNDLLCYNIYALNNEKFVSAKQLVVGDIVTVKSVVTNYSGTIEPKGGYITRTTNTFDPSTVDTTPKEITVKDALALSIAEGATADGLYKMTGVIATVTEPFSTQYGNATFTIQDESSPEEFICYRVKYLNNEKWTEDKPQIQAGQIVTLIGAIKNHYGTIELVDGYISEHVTE